MLHRYRIKFNKRSPNIAKFKSEIVPHKIWYFSNSVSAAIPQNDKIKNLGVLRLLTYELEENLLLF